MCRLHNLFPVKLISFFFVLIDFLFKSDRVATLPGNMEKSGTFKIFYMLSSKILICNKKIYPINNFNFVIIKNVFY